MKKLAEIAGAPVWLAVVVFLLFTVGINGCVKVENPRFKKGDLVKHRLGGGEGIVTRVWRRGGSYQCDVEYAKDEGTGKVIINATFQEESLILVEPYGKPEPKEPEKKGSW